MADSIIKFILIPIFKNFVIVFNNKGKSANIPIPNQINIHIKKIRIGSLSLLKFRTVITTANTDRKAITKAANLVFILQPPWLLNSVFVYIQLSSNNSSDYAPSISKKSFIGKTIFST